MFLTIRRFSGSPTLPRRREREERGDCENNPVQPWRVQPQGGEARGSGFVDTTPGAKEARKGRRLAKRGREGERESRNSFMENSRFFISVPRFLPYGWVARHSSLGFTPLIPRPREGEGRKFGTYGGKARRGAYFIYYFARRRAWRTLGGMGRGRR